ncbi:MAG TPA: acetolactate synthase large subunit, partial [Methanomassiliicoccales archaeon]|nr:acetolactate synthase large subunit [Methanomassiliicoccales archaeon]
DSTIKFTLTKHENSAAFIANACARLTGKAGVCLSTLGPGATNMVTGVADAFLSNVPLIAITGQVGAERAYHPTKQYIDLVQMFKPITKDSFSIKTASRIPVQTRRAFSLACEEKPGPVHLELPEDVMRDKIEGRPVRRSEKHLIHCEPGQADSVRKVFSGSRTPIIFAGPGAIRAGATTELNAFARAWNMPVVHTWYGAGILPYDDPLSLNTVGLRASDTVRGAFFEADLVVLVGYDLPEFSPNYWNVGKQKEVVVIDSVPAETVPNFEPSLQVIGDLRGTLVRLTSGAIPRPNWIAPFKEDLKECIQKCPLDGSPVKPQLAVKAIREVLGRGDICTSDVGAHLIWLAKRYPVFEPNTLLLSNGLIPMGVGVPSAIGAKLVHPEKKVVAVCGDAGFMMSGSELETAKRLGTNFVTVIFDDRDLGLIRTKHQRALGRHFDTSFGNPDFVRFAESFGAKGYRVGSAAELQEALRSALASDELAVIDVPVDYEENKSLF